MPKYFFLLLCCVMAAFLSCDNNPTAVIVQTSPCSVGGRILPITSRALVTAIQGTLTATDSCDENGRFQIDGLSPGSCQIEVSAAGYGMYRTTVTLTSGGFTQVGDITLQTLPYPLSWVSPAAQSEWNSLNLTAIIISFSQPMDTSATTAAVTVTPAFDGDRYWTSGNTQLYIRAYSSLRPATSYTVSIDTAAVTVDGRHLEFACRYSFVTEPFRITSSNPQHGQENIGLDQLFYLYFNAPANQARTQASVHIVPATELAFDWSGNSVKIRPQNGFWIADTTYVLTIDTSAADVWGTPIVAPFSARFSTSVGKITSFSPKEGDKNVSLGTTVSIRFNTAMNESLTTASFSLADSLNNIVDGRVEWSTNNDVLTFTPRHALQSSMRYCARIDSNAQDAAGRPLGDSAVCFFTEPFRITGFTPRSGSTNVGISEQVTLYFNTNCNTASIEQSTYAEPATSLIFSYNGTTVSIRPQSKYWKTRTAYTIVVGKTALDAWGGALADSVVIEFSTAAGGVSSMIPGDGTHNVSLTTSMYGYFHTAMNPATTAAAVRIFAHPDTLVAGSFSWGSGNTYFTFTPQAFLRPATTYTFIIDSTATDIFGAAISPVVSTFTTEHLRVTYDYPRNNTGAFELNERPYLTFNSAFDATRMQSAFSIQPPIELDITFDHVYLYFKPRQTYWKSTTKYTVTIDTSAHDAWGKPMAAPYTYVFFTQPAAVSQIVPAFGQTGVDVNNSISITFNTAMNAASVNSAFTLADSATATAVTGTMSGANTSFTFSPSAPLAAATTYIVTVAATAADAFGVAMPKAWTSKFRTQ